MLFITVSATRVDVPSLFTDSNEPKADDINSGKIAIIIYNLPQFGGRKCQGFFKFGGCINLLNGCNNMMSSFKLSQGSCLFFDNYGCEGLIFSSKPGIYGRPVYSASIPPGAINRVSAMKCVN